MQDDLRCTLLMMKDIPVLRFNFSTAVYDVLDELHLPYQLKGLLREMPQYHDGMTKYEFNQSSICGNKNKDAIIDWLAERALPLTRENAKKVYNLFGFAQLESLTNKARIAIACRALSLQDNYWIKLDGDSVKWDDVDLRKVHLNEDIAQVSLCGSSFSIQNKQGEAVRCPELTGQGAYAKAWFREDGGLYLHKLGHQGVTESKIEVMVSNLLDNCNVKHLHYDGSWLHGTYTCKCKCMTTETISMLPGMDFECYCNRKGKSSLQEAIKLDPEMMYKMMIVDYLIANPDRHGMNWGFFYNCDTMEILGCHPLYDHNNSFDSSYMQDPGAQYILDDSKSMRDWAKYAMSKVDFHFYREPVREDFNTDRQFKCFTHRAKELGIQVHPDVADESHTF